MAGSMSRLLCHSTKGRVITLTSVLLILTILYTVRSPTLSRTASLDPKNTLVVAMTGAHNFLNPSAKEIQTPTAKSKKFPTVLIIGVRKGGTRALIDMLKGHPDIVTATTEIHYFDRNENFGKGSEWYISKMPYSSVGQITVEKSPSYFVTTSVPQRVAAASPDMKLILIVRNPIDRAISDYTQLAQRSIYRSFEGAVFQSPSGEINTKLSTVSVSMYDVHLKRWLEYFNLSQIHLVNGDVLISNPVGELKKTEDFLGVKSYFTKDMFYFNSTKGFYCWKKKADRKGEPVSYCLGNGKGRHHLQVLNSTKQRLHEFFEPHNERFFSQVKQRFNWDVTNN